MWPRAFVTIVLLIFNLSLSFENCLKCGSGLDGKSDTVRTFDSVVEDDEANLDTKRATETVGRRFIMKETDELIREAGFHAESHIIDLPVEKDIQIVEDGIKKNTFKIKIFRLRAPDKKNAINLPVVFMMSGCSGSSSDYVFGGKDNGLAFKIAERGYDVWIGNLRGNFYGGLHIKTSKFWDFSFHEIGVHDLPAQIDYVLEKTQQEKLSYVGWSMGTTVSYVMLSLRPKYNNKIEKMISLAPVVFLDISAATTISKFLLGLQGILDKLSKKMNIRYFSYRRAPLPFFKKPSCFKRIKKSICKSALNDKWMSESTTLKNETLRDAFFRILPVGTSCKTIVHYSQVARSGEFTEFSPHNGDVGTPSRYPLEEIKVPTFLLAGKKDRFITETAMNYLIGNLTGIPRESLHHAFVKDDNFMHLDVYVSNNLETNIFKPVLNYLETGDPEPQSTQVR